MAEATKLIDLGFVNAYLVKAGDAYILIDTGVPQRWSRLEAELLAAKALPDHLKLVIITHSDFDHTGNCAQLQQKYHAKIAMHPADADVVKTGMTVKRQSKTLLGKLLLLLGSLMRGRFQKFQPDILLEDGQALDAFGWAARVLYTPGHTKGSIAVLTPDGELFAGDTFTNRGKPDSAQFIESKQDLRASLAVLKGLKAHTVYPGHGKPFPFEAVASIPE